MSPPETKENSLPSFDLFRMLSNLGMEEYGRGSMNIWLEGVT